MLVRVKRWLDEGKDVRIMTARVDGLAEAPDPDVPRRAIEAWCLEHLGQVLPVTNRKDMHMIELWDDRAVSIIPNTGQIGTAYLLGGPFICGQGGPVDSMGLPETLLVCPAVGLDGVAAYKLSQPYSAPGY
jgi:hypothetical protein